MKAEVLQQFIKEYMRIRPVSAVAYNKIKSAGLPSWQKAARSIGLRKWSELLNAACIEKRPRESVVSVECVGGLEGIYARMDELASERIKDTKHSQRAK